MDRESKRVAILSAASAAFGIGLFGYTIATAKPPAHQSSSAPNSAKEVPAAAGAASGGSQASCGANGCGSNGSKKQGGQR